LSRMKPRVIRGNGGARLANEYRPPLNFLANSGLLGVFRSGEGLVGMVFEEGVVMLACLEHGTPLGFEGSFLQPWR
jgi:hypothetical protein